ncbi:transcription initiation factor TFIID subunit 4-like [Lutra lutra]|uniref:transcription initiation factor TFIID subunit 4-like n=1 Tax=Lutra lutra TaxID=9657 RepID=UPI001FD2C584|nr:transcription initiation factor TFIID subunit 4-like [Lutra lutra]
MSVFGPGPQGRQGDLRPERSAKVTAKPATVPPPSYEVLGARSLRAARAPARSARPCSSAEAPPGGERRHFRQQGPGSASAQPGAQRPRGARWSVPASPGPSATPAQPAGTRHTGWWLLASEGAGTPFGGFTKVTGAGRAIEAGVREGGGGWDGCCPDAPAPPPGQPGGTHRHRRLLPPLPAALPPPGPPGAPGSSFLLPRIFGHVCPHSSESPSWPPPTSVIFAK